MPALHTTIPPSVRGQIDAAISALDILMDTADGLRLFELRAIANHAFFALDGYAAERDDRPVARVCESCNAGWHEEPAAKECECACHGHAHTAPPRIPVAREILIPVLGRIA